MIIRSTSWSVLPGCFEHSSRSRFCALFICLCAKWWKTPYVIFFEILLSPCSKPFPSNHLLSVRMYIFVKSPKDIMTKQQAWKIAVTEFDHEHYHTLQSGYVPERSVFNWQTKDMTASYSRADNFQDVNCSVYNHFSLTLMEDSEK